MNDSLKLALNELQIHIDSKSNKVLLIFDNQWKLDWFVKRRKQEIAKGELDDDYFDDKELITLDDLVYNHGLVGRRFRLYHFDVL